MKLLDFFFNKKTTNASCCSSSNNGKKLETGAKLNDTQYHSSDAPLKSKDYELQEFVFKSNCHQRYENGTPVKGLQNTPRTVSVEKNTNGCRGYKIQPGVGYIVNIFNDEINRLQMSAKPMKIVGKSSDRVELRGYPLEAMSPFGWQEVNYSDYGLTIEYKDGEVSQCTLHMFDRNIDLKYMHNVASGEHKSASLFTSQRKGEAETLVDEALSQLARGNDGDAVYHPLFKAWRSIQNAPRQLKQLVNPERVGQGMMIFLSYGTVKDIDDQQQLASIAYLLISQSIENGSQNINNYKNRLLILATQNEAFGYTVSSVLEKNTGWDPFDIMAPFKSRDSLLKMEYADLSVSHSLCKVNLFASLKYDLENKISNHFFGNDATRASIIVEGKKLHTEVTAYLKEKLLDQEDLDF